MFRHLPEDCREIERQISELEQAGLVTAVSHVAHASSLLPSAFLVAKKGTTKRRMVIDYRAVNNVIECPPVQLPDARTALEALRGAQVFGSIDLRSAFWQIPLDRGAELTAFLAPSGEKYIWNVLPFGVSSAPAICQSIVGRVLRGLHFSACIVYLDDILIWGVDRAQFLRNLDTVLERLQQAQLFVSASKCQLARAELKFLGHVVDQNGIRVDEEKVAAISRVEVPRTVTEVRAFIGMLNFHGEALPGLQCVIRELNALTGSKSRKVEVKGAALEAFHKAKRLLQEAATLARFDPDNVTLIVTDASDVGAGAGLYQRAPNAAWRPLAFWSKGFNNSTQLRWPTWEKEMFALVAVCRAWAHWIHGAKHRVLVWTDNSVVQHFRSATFGVGGVESAKVMRWAIELSMLPIDVSHIPGSTNVVADFLSRKTIAPGDGTLQRMERDEDIGDRGEALEFALPIRCAPARELDPILVPFDDASEYSDDVWRRAYLQCAEFGTDYRRLEAATAGGRRVANDQVLGPHLFKGVVQSGGRTLVPTTLRRRIVVEMHKRMGHPGPDRLLRALQARFHWAKIRQDTKEIAGQCRTCAMVKAQARINRVVNAPFPMPPQRFAEVSMDFAILPPEPDHRGVVFDKLLVIVDRATRFVVAIPCNNHDRAPTVWRLLEDQFFCRFGPPATALTDQDPLFTSEFWQDRARGSGIRWVFAAVGAAQTDGLSERTIRSLKQLFRLMKDDNPQLSWPDLVQSVTFCHNTTPHSRLKASPFQLVHGFTPEVLPRGLAPPPTDIGARDLDADVFGERMDSQLQAAHEIYNQEMENTMLDVRQSLPIRVGDWVLLAARKRRGAALWRPRWVGPYRVTHSAPGGATEVDFDGRRRWFNARHLVVVDTSTWDEEPIQRQAEEEIDRRVAQEWGGLRPLDELPQQAPADVDVPDARPSLRDEFTDSSDSDDDDFDRLLNEDLRRQPLPGGFMARRTGRR